MCDRHVFADVRDGVQQDGIWSMWTTPKRECIECGISLEEWKAQEDARRKRSMSIQIRPVAFELCSRLYPGSTRTRRPAAN